MEVDTRTAFGYMNKKATATMRLAQSNITTVAKQITSGKFADNYTDLIEKTPVESLLGIKQVYGALEVKNTANKLLSSKIREIENSLRILSEDIVKDSTVLCMKAKDPASGSSVDITALSKDKLEQIKGVLNATFNGERLFAGSKIKVGDVVSDISLFTNIVSGNVTANYYKGDTDTFSAKISSARTLDYGVTADNSAIAHLIAAHHYMINNDFDNAMNALGIAKQGLGDLVTKIGNSSSVVQQQIINDDASIIRMSESIANIQDVDVAELMPKLSMLEVQLKASFMVTSQLQNLSLVNFL